jgi:hypothetical protein
MGNLGAEGKKKKPAALLSSKIHRRNADYIEPTTSKRTTLKNV